MAFRPKLRPLAAALSQACAARTMLPLGMALTGLALIPQAFAQSQPLSGAPEASLPAAASAVQVAQAAPPNAAAAAPTLPVVEVRASAEAQPGANPYADPQAPYKVDRLSSGKFTEPVLDTPRTVTVITKEALDDKNTTSLREIGRSTAGVTLGSGEGGNAFGDRFFIRGFDARNDIFVDGVRDPGVSIRENYNTEQVEILRGPASSFAGRGTTGGAINIVTKEAQDVDFIRAQTTYGFIDMTKRVTLDVNKAINPMLDIRLNGLYQEASVAGRDYTTDNRNGVAGALTFKPTSDFTLKAGVSYTHLFGQPDFGVPYDQSARIPVTEGLVPRSTYYGILNRDFTESTQTLATLNTEWKVNSQLTLENKFRYGHSLLNYIGTIPENPSGAALAAFASTPTFFSGFVQLNAQSRYEPVDVFVDQPQATFKFDFGSAHHTAIVGAEFSREKLSIDTYSGLTSELTTGPVAFASSGAPVVSVYNPTNFLFTASSPTLTGNPLRYKIDTNAVYVMDTANFNDTVILNGGVRFDDYKITSSNNTSRVSANAGIVSYNAGIVYKPMQIASIYAAFATAAEPVGAEVDATASAYGGLAATQNVAQVYGPQRSKAYELGTKWELFDRHLLTTAAAFQTDVTNARETAPAGIPGVTSGTIIAGAAYRVQGLDFEVAGKLTDRWSVQGGLVLLKTEVTQSVNPNNVGLQLANIAHQSFNLLTKYKTNDWLEFGGQGIYASQIKGGSLLVANGGVAYPGAPNPTILPSHWRFDVFSEAKVTKNTSLKLYVQNLFNKTYYDSLYQSVQPFIMVAPGRNISLIASMKF